MTRFTRQNPCRLSIKVKEGFRQSQGDFPSARRHCERGTREAIHHHNPPVFLCLKLPIAGARFRPASADAVRRFSTRVSTTMVPQSSLPLHDRDKACCMLQNVKQKRLGSRGPKPFGFSFVKYAGIHWRYSY